jgi:predicted DNA-binding protein (MmcQ/YjbR family)
LCEKIPQLWKVITTLKFKENELHTDKISDKNEIFTIEDKAYQLTKEVPSRKYSSNNTIADDLDLDEESGIFAKFKSYVPWPLKYIHHNIIQSIFRTE